MNPTDCLNTYAEGWTNGDAGMILSAVSADFVFDDPNAGHISKAEIVDYLSAMKATALSLHGGALPEPFMQLREVVTDAACDTLTAWCWWEVPGTPLKGSGLIKVGVDGVTSEVVSYYTRLPD